MLVVLVLMILVLLLLHATWRAVDLALNEASSSGPRAGSDGSSRCRRRVGSAGTELARCQLALAAHRKLYP